MLNLILESEDENLCLDRISKNNNEDQNFLLNPLYEIELHRFSLIVLNFSESIKKPHGSILHELVFGRVHVPKT